MKRFLIIIWITAMAGLAFSSATAQEINFSRQQDMTTWYNPALKTDKMKSLKLNYRNINYSGITAFNSTSGIFDMALPAEGENAGYFSFSLGGASDKSNDGILSNTLGMAGIAYAIPLGSNETYMSAGAQGAYYQSRLKTGGSGVFADQYDVFGPVEGAASGDALAGGWSYGYFTMNAGVSVFSNSETGKWHLGVSAMNVNKPYTDQIKTDDYRQNIRMGVQAGYKAITAEKDEFAFYASMNWQGGAYRHFFNGLYFKSIKGFDGGVGIGLGYRYDDALVPGAEIRYEKALIAVSYDVNVSSINASAINRNGLELALRFDF